VERERVYVNIDELKLGGLQEEHEVTTWNLETLSELAWRQRKSSKLLSCWPGTRPSR